MLFVLFPPSKQFLDFHYAYGESIAPSSLILVTSNVTHTSGGRGLHSEVGDFIIKWYADITACR